MNIQEGAAAAAAAAATAAVAAVAAVDDGVGDRSAPNQMRNRRSTRAQSDQNKKKKHAIAFRYHALPLASCKASVKFDKLKTEPNT